MRLLVWICCIVLFSLASPGQSLRLVTNAKQGFKVRIPRFLKEVPPQPNENDLLAKFKGTKAVKLPRGRVVRDRSGKRVKTFDLPLEVWIVRLPLAGRAVETPRGGKSGPSDRTRRSPAKAAGIESVLRRRLRGATIVNGQAEGRPLRNRAKKPYTLTRARVARRSEPIAWAYSVEQQHPKHGRELFGIVFVCQYMEAFASLIPGSVRSLQRLDPVQRVYSKADPYAGSKLRDLPRRRAVRAQMVKGWYAEDTENFILVTDMTNNTGNRRLLRDMLVDVEIMRTAFNKRFPPIRPLTVVSTVRVCNSYDGYLRYSNKPGTGGYWHPLLEELVLFNPVGKIKKAAWMRKVTPKAILYHEAMHQYFHYANGQMPPASWFNEGYGEYFGAAKTDRFGKSIRKIGKNEFRWSLVKQYRKEKRWPSIKQLLQMSQPVFYSRTSKTAPVLQNYAFAWAFCYFLEQERGKRPQQRNEEWARLADRYLLHLRSATAEYAKKLPANAPAHGLLRYAIPVQRQAYQRTFKNVDFKALQADWIAAIKSW